MVQGLNSADTDQLHVDVFPATFLWHIAGNIGKDWSRLDKTVGMCETPQQ